MNVVFIWKEGTLKVSREEYAVMGRHQHPQVLPLSPLLLWWPLNIGHVTWRGYNGVHLDKAASMWAIWLFLSGSLMHLNSCDSSQHFPRRKEELLQTSLLASSFPSYSYLYNSRKAKSLWWFGDLISDVLREGACGIPLMSSLDFCFSESWEIECLWLKTCSLRSFVMATVDDKHTF